MDKNIVPIEDPIPQVVPDVVIETPTPISQAPDIPIPEVKCWRDEA